MMPGSLTVTTGSPQWWAALAETAAVRAWCYHRLGMAAEARKWLGVSADCSVQLGKAVRL